MPPGVGPFLAQDPVMVERSAKISFHELNQKLEQTEKNAVDIERELHDARSHLKELREHMTFNGSNSHKLELTSIEDLKQQFQRLLHTPASMDKYRSDEMHNKPALEASKLDNEVEHYLRIEFEGAEMAMSKVKQKVDEVQAELQIAWLSLTTLQVEFNSKQDAYIKQGVIATSIADKMRVENHADLQSVEAFLHMMPVFEAMQDQLEKKNKLLEQLSGSYEHLRHSFIEKEEELRNKKGTVISTFKALTASGADLKLDAFQKEVARAKRSLSMQVQDWCATTEKQADEKSLALKKLRTELASTASNLLHIIDLDTKMAAAEANFVQHKLEQPEQQPTQDRCMPGAGASPKVKGGLSPESSFQDISKRIEVLVQELKSERVQQDNVIDNLRSSNEDLAARPEYTEREVPQEVDKAESCVEDVDYEMKKPEELNAKTVADSTTEATHLPATVQANTLSSAKERSENVKGKRKLSEAFSHNGFNVHDNSSADMVHREKDFLRKKKAFLSGLHDSFKRVRQREIVCVSLDKRLLKARLLLEQAQRGCAGSDFVSMRSKRQIEQAYKEVVHVQRDIKNMKGLSLELESPSSETPEEKVECLPDLSLPTWEVNEVPVMKNSDWERLSSELERQREMNMQLTQQVAKFCLQAERAEGLLAVERLEVHKLRKQVRGVSEKLKQEARSLNDAAMRAREMTIERLREQLRQNEEKSRPQDILRLQLDAALQKNEELSVERDALVSRIGGQHLDLMKLRNENVCLVVEKIAFEGSARALQEKMGKLMTKLTETKQHWKRFVVYCEAF